MKEIKGNRFWFELARGFELSGVDCNYNNSFIAAADRGSDIIPSKTRIVHGQL